jgi:glycosyltransferase involved in cell wall biosynthesis
VNILNIVFYYPSRIVGGAEWLFIRMAQALSEKDQYYVYVVDFQDGFLNSKLVNSKVKILEFSIKNRIKIDNDAIVIVPISHVRLANAHLDLPDSARVLLWSIHPHNVLYLFGGAEWFYQLGENYLEKTLRIFYPFDFLRVRSAVNIAHEKCGLVVMDKANQESIEKTLGLQLKPAHFLPIPLEKSQIQKANHVESSLEISWIGRISDDKVFALLRVLSDAEQFAQTTKTKVRVNIIGSGSKQKMLRAAFARFPTLEIRELGTLDSLALEELLTTQTDVVVAMGTSLIEAARYGIPTILVDPSYQAMPSGLPYQWFFELHSFNLGTVVSRKNPPILGVILSGMLEALRIPSESTRLGLACLEHFRKFHQLEQVLAQCEDILERNTLTVADLREAGLISKQRKLR